MSKINRTVLHNSVPTIHEFSAGGTVRSDYDLFRNQDGLWKWGGAVPHVVPSESTPESNGGTGDSLWSIFSDSGLRIDLQEGDGTLVGLTNGTLKDAINYVTPEMFGAKGDALVSRNLPLNGVITGKVALTRTDATDDTEAIRAAINSGYNVKFDGSKGYLVSDAFVYTTNNLIIDGCGAVIVYRGGKAASTGVRRVSGIFQPQGTFDRYDTQAKVVSDAKLFDTFIDVEAASNKLGKGDWFTLYGHNGVADADFESKVVKQAYYLVQVRKVEVISPTVTRLHTSYKFGFDYKANELQIGSANPIYNPVVKNFTLIDEMPATPTPDTLPTPEAPASEKAEAVSLFRTVCAVSPQVENLTGYNIKWPLAHFMFTQDFSAKTLRNYYPTWFGGGEGYCVCVNWSHNFYTADLRMYGGRHVFDATIAGWGLIESAIVDEDQVGLTLHTSNEHDLTFSNCSSRRMQLANGAYGKVTARIRFEQCNFGRVVVEGCLDLVLRDTNADDVLITAGSVIIEGASTLRNTRYIQKDNRVGVDDYLGLYSTTGRCYIGKMVVLHRNPSTTSGNEFNSWYRLTIDGTVTADNSDPKPSFDINNIVKFSFSGESVGAKFFIRGRTQSISFVNSVITFKRTGLGSAISVGDVTGLRATDVQAWKILDSTFDVHDSSRPYQITQPSQGLTAPYNLAVTVGGNLLLSGLPATVSDTPELMSIVACSARKDATRKGNDTVVSVKDDAIRFIAGDTMPNRHTGATPAIRNISNTGWVSI